MGAHSSKIKNHDRYSKITSDLTSDLTFYRDSCQREPFLQSFDSSIKQSTSRVINSLSSDVGDRSLSLDSLRELTDCILKPYQEVVKLILECKNDILKNNYLLDFVKDYFDNSGLTLDVCNALQKCLNRARDSQLTIQHAIDQFEQEQKDFPRRENNFFIFNGKRKMYESTLQELKNFTTAGNPFTADSPQKQECSLTLRENEMLKSVYESQSSMLEKLAAKKSKLDKKLKKIKAWRTVSNVIFVVTFTSVLICSVLATAIAAPPVVTALAAAAALPMGTMGEWMNSLWKKYENDLKGQSEVMTSLERWTCIGKCDLDHVRVLVDRSKIEIESLLHNADFAVKKETAVILAMDEMKKKLDGFMKSIDDLSKHTEDCSRDIMEGRMKILDTIFKHHK
ncbi:UPF0496 protein At4g34320-like [Cornus florida]|uniref:UPF0496 protein At4g34320-like n=1 Tax=Cornus florida TaxID=4283 RepID=UPI00289FD65F|nr:UPF0496 protein At4g34320-like [Cornus florida]